jgi:aminopeptidase N
MRLPAFVALSLLALTAPAAAKQAPLAERTKQTGLPLTDQQARTELPHLALSLTIDPARKRIVGEARYRVRAKAELNEAQFDLDPRFRITQVSVDGAALPRTRWSNDGGLLTIELPAQLAPGAEAEVAIAYAGEPFVAARAPWDGGFVWDKTPAGQPWIASAIQGEGCDMFWPCIDSPLSKIALLDLSLRVPEPLVAAGNGKLLGVDRADGWATWRWRARYPNNYGVTVQVGPYEVAEADYASRYGNTVPLKFYHLPGHAEGAQRLLGELASALDFFERTVGPYPFGDEKAGLAETPHLGMEHQTINAYGNGFVRAPEGYDWLLHHEFSHEWFANQMTNRGDEEMWLHEGFGTYMQPLYLRWRDGELAYHVALWDSRRKIVGKVPLVPPAGAPMPDYNDAKTGWGGDIYYRGAWVLHTLREQIGDAAFERCLRLFVYGQEDPKPGNFMPILRSTAEFQGIVEQVTGKPWGWFFDAYVRQGALPRLDATREGATLHLAWSVESGAAFPLPVEVKIGERIVTVPMTGGRGTVALGDPQVHYVLDPDTKLLRYDQAIDDFRAQEAAAAAKRTAEAE